MRRVLLLALAGLFVAVVHADTLNVSGDAQTSSGQPGVNFGFLPSMTVRGASTGPILNSSARFDFSALPAAPSVDKAVLAVGDAPFGVAFDGARIWVANSNSATVSKL